jgi:hypothetical protein
LLPTREKLLRFMAAHPLQDRREWGAQHFSETPQPDF